MPFLAEPLYVATILCLLVGLAEWLARQTLCHVAEDIITTIRIVASNANIGGATSAGALAIAIGRGDLRLPGILAGSLGNAIGTYAGFVIAELLK